ncbi:carbohydrate ABC transporter permease [Paenibacillus sp. OAS669]|uniref:carbohydrate ABC transporter permease n=1 Tax=Paenibacillus sp. OAS669 TaxID=2663821 RepID=UPI00178B90BC|nr:carbohydrate ABC transporter permease [Paenibacillus sp. OAS669]MBE1446189.1 putative aldouronate transport system permease protein [Paenibacillus sp. OAS669]
MKHTTLGDSVFRYTNGALLALLAFLTCFPFYYVVVVSFTDPGEYLQKKWVLFPDHWSLASYEYLLSTKAFLRSVGNSAFLAIVGTICSLTVTSTMAYALSRKRMRGRKAILFMVLLTMLFSPGLIPHYMLVRQMGLIGSVWSLIIPALASGWNVILMKGFSDSIPAELDESAAIDGSNDIRTWVTIVLPLSLPAIAAFALFDAVGYWNQFFSALLYLNDSSQWPIQVLLQNMLLNASNTDLQAYDVSMQPPPSEMLKMAAVVVATVPILLVYPFLQKHFAKGAMVGSIKA